MIHVHDSYKFVSIDCYIDLITNYRTGRNQINIVVFKLSLFPTRITPCDTKNMAENCFIWNFVIHGIVISGFECSCFLALTEL